MRTAVLLYCLQVGRTLCQTHRMYCCCWMPWHQALWCTTHTFLRYARLCDITFLCLFRLCCLGSSNNLVGWLDSNTAPLQMSAHAAHAVTHARSKCMCHSRDLYRLRFLALYCLQYAHLDFGLGTDASERLYPTVVQLLLGHIAQPQAKHEPPTHPHQEAASTGVAHETRGKIIAAASAAS